MSHSKSNIKDPAFPRYERYNDPGIVWVGKIPSHWDVKPGRVTLSLNKEKNAENIDDEVFAPMALCGVRRHGKLVVSITKDNPVAIPGFQERP